MFLKHENMWKQLCISYKADSLSQGYSKSVRNLNHSVITFKFQE